MALMLAMVVRAFLDGASGMTNGTNVASKIVVLSQKVRMKIIKSFARATQFLSCVSSKKMFGGGHEPSR